jgi:alpha-mannosidase
MAELSAMAGDAGPKPDLAADWALLLRNQFHDILPGSSIREVYEQTEPELKGIVERAEAAATDKLQAIAARHGRAGTPNGLAIANLSGSAKPHWQVESARPLPAALRPQQVGERWVVASDQALPPLSVSFAAVPASGAVSVSAGGLENALVKVTLDAHGRIASLIDKRCGRELMAGPGNALMVYRNDLPRTYDAWDIEPGFALGGEELTALESLTVTAEGPHLGEVTIVRKLGASSITQRLRLWSNSARLDIVTDIDWHDRRTYVRAAFPVTVLASEAVYDQGIGVTRRPTHDNTSWEKAQFEGSGHRFASLSETDWGAALLSADKYGFSVKANVMTLSLIRGPSYPDMLADEGRHHFTYAILPHDGRWWSEAVQAEADLVNDKLRFVPAQADAPWTLQPVKWEGQQMRFHALKPLEDGGGTLLRLSEAAGRRGPIMISGPGGAVSALDGLERESTESVDTVRPFRLMSVRV